MKKVIATWSGGKDSCFATYKTIQQGYEVAYIANTISEDYKRVRFHGLLADIIQKQADSIGIPLLQKETTPKDYEKEFKQNLERGISKEIKGIVFGDIHLKDCLTWATRLCDDLGVQIIEPLWHMKQKDILQEFIKAGFEAIIVSTQSNILGKEWIGRKIDKQFIKEIEKLKDIDMCGENGEYHSLVINGPLFKKRLKIEKSESVLREGYWFLDIQGYQLI
ncbi:MAG: diphthine--ammonia ligase [Nitrosotalea sp.]